MPLIFDLSHAQREDAHARYPSSGPLPDPPQRGGHSENMIDTITRALIAAMFVLATILTTPSVQSAQVAAAESSRTLNGGPKAAIVRVECTTFEGVSVGTAVHMGRGRYATARHVVAAPETCEVLGAGIQVTYADEPTDFAMFTGAEAAEKAKISCQPFRFGRMYQAAGYAFGGYEIFDEPLLSSGLVDENNIGQFIGEVIPGMSGGPVSDREGRVRGVVSMRWPARAVRFAGSPLCRL